MPALFAEEALLPAGWQRDVLIEWDAEGTLTRVEANAAAPGVERAKGPVLPGMPNVHSHAFQRAMAGLAETRGHPTDDFWTWRESMYHLVTHLEPEDVQAIASQLYVEMLKHGYTAVAEFHYLHHDRDGRRYADPAELSARIIESAHEAGIALTLLPVLYAHGGFGHRPLAPAQKRFAGDPDSIAELLRELVRGYLPRPLLRLGVAPHSARAVDALMLTDLVAMIDGIDATMPIHMHVSEQSGEVAECIATHGTTPYAWVSDIVPVDRRWCFIHATHLTTTERRRLGESGACIGLCPATEANLGDGIFEFPPWFEGGHPWGIGGDSHVCVSPFEELRALEESQRLRLRIRNVASSEERPDVAANLWSEAARGGAQAIAQPVGALMAGRRADLVVLQGDHVDFESLAASARLAVAVFSGNSNRVRDVIVSGHLVVSEGRHPREAETAAAFRAALRRLRARP